MTISKFKIKSIKSQLIVICTLLVVIPVTVLGIMSYSLARREIFSNVERTLDQQAKGINLLLKKASQEIKAEDKNIEHQAKAIVKETSEVVYELIMSTTDDEKLKNILAKVVVGETGYIWITDYKGVYVISKNRKRDGEDIWNSKDANGRFFIQSAVAKTRRLKGNQVDYEVYPWKNIGETKTRNKIAALIHDPKRKWVIGVSTYFDELVDVTYKKRILENLKDSIASLVIGKTGYVYILDDEGKYILSSKRMRDGENIWNAVDAAGNFFIQEIVTKAKKLREGTTGIQYYPWKNAGESVARQKLACYFYFKEFGWTIAPSAYHSEFLDGLKVINTSTVVVVLFSVVIGSIIAYLFAIFITKSIDLLKYKMHQVASGNLTVRLDEKLSSNELGDMQKSFGIMLQYLKSLVHDITINANSTASTAEEVSVSAQEVNITTKKTSVAIQEISKGSKMLSKSSHDVKEDTEGLISSIKSVAYASQESAKQAKEANESAVVGADAAKKAGGVMNEIHASASNTAREIAELEAASKEIGKIIEVIALISKQTNLLALNAAIEAARAGEAGKGFAVVAEEVRKLAEDAQRSTKQIEEMIRAIQNKTKTSAENMNKAEKTIQKGGIIINEAVSALNNISEKVLDVASSIQEISIATQGQLRSSTKVQKAIGQVTTVAHESAASTAEVSILVSGVTSAMQSVTNASNNVAKNADLLKQMVIKFEV